MTTAVNDGPVPGQGGALPAAVPPVAAAPAAKAQAASQSGVGSQSAHGAAVASSGSAHVPALTALK